MSEDLVTRLREMAHDAFGYERGTLVAAANEIERLRAVLAEAKAEERAKILAWLRGEDQFDNYGSYYDPAGHKVALLIEQVEAGEHDK